MAVSDLPEPRWVKLLDQSRCIGCHACTTACKSENEVPVGVTRTYVKSVDVGLFPQVRRAFQVTRCNQCTDAPCVRVCPTGASYYGPGGIVLIDPDMCTGCKACIAACPYGARFIDPATHTADKCTLCVHRLEHDVPTTACQEICPTESIHVGNLADPASEVSRLLAEREHHTLEPEAGTRPNLYYLR